MQCQPDTTMLFAPFKCTHPPPPVLLFLLVQNLSPKKSVAPSDITSWKLYEAYICICVYHI